MEHPIKPSDLSGKRRLVISISLLLLAGFIVTSVISYHVARATIRSNIIANDLPLTSDNIYSEIQKDLVRQTFISSMMAHDTFLRNWVLAGETDIAGITQYLREIKEHYHALTSFFVSERSRIYYQANGVLKRIKADEPRDIWYFRVSRMTNDYEINVDPDLANRDILTIFINFRVFDFAGNFLGAAGVGLHVDSVRKLIDSYQKRYRRSIYFVEPSGRIRLSGNQMEKEGSNIRETEGLAAIAGDILTKRESSLQYNRNDQTHLLNVRLIPELGWYLFVEKNELEATGTIRSALILNIALSIAVTLVIIVIVNLTIRGFRRKLETLASTDQLTGLANRHTLSLVCGHMIKDTRRSAYPISIIIIDIDHFKRVNDSWGHPAGDAVLRETAARIRESLRETDLASRWGGEEFLLVLPRCPLSDARGKAESIRKLVAGMPFKAGTQEINLTVSIGVAEYTGAESQESVFARADRALFRAKQDGRNQVQTDP